MRARLDLDPHAGRNLRAASLFVNRATYEKSLVGRRFFSKRITPRGFRRKNDPYGNRTRVAAVKGRCPRPLDEGAVFAAAIGLPAYRGYRQVLPAILAQFF